MPTPATHPPAPGGFVEPNLTAVEDALRVVTFPISKRDLLDLLVDDETIVLRGRNVDLRTLIRDLPDDFFESEEEFHEQLQNAYGFEADAAESHELAAPRPEEGEPPPEPTPARAPLDVPDEP